MDIRQVDCEGKERADLHLRLFVRKAGAFPSVAAIYEPLNTVVRVYDSIREGVPGTQSLFCRVFASLLTFLAAGANVGG